MLRKSIFSRPPILGIFVFAVLFLCGTYHTAAQSVCPPEMVCISRDAAKKSVADAILVDAQKAEIATLKQAVADQKDLTQNMKVEFAACSGENTALRQNAVSDRAIIDILLKNVRPKKIGLINF